MANFNANIDIFIIHRHPVTISVTVFSILTKNDVKIANGKRIDDVTNESEYWKAVNDISNPKSDIKWKLIEDGVNLRI